MNDYKNGKTHAEYQREWRRKRAAEDPEYFNRQRQEYLKKHPGYWRVGKARLLAKDPQYFAKSMKRWKARNPDGYYRGLARHCLKKLGKEKSKALMKETFG